MTITRKTIKVGQKPKLTRAQRKQIADAYRRPIVEDEDAPFYSYEELAEMRKMADAKRSKEREEQQKQVVAIRLSPTTLAQVKATGKGYTGFLARLIENAMKDKDLVAKSL